MLVTETIRQFRCTICELSRVLRPGEITPRECPSCAGSHSVWRAQRIDPSNTQDEDGRILTDADFEALATEAEKGYDVSDLPRRTGRPLIGSSPAIVVPIRMPADLLAATQALAGDEETSVSELVRDAVAAYLSTEPASLEFSTYQRSRLGRCGLRIWSLKEPQE